MGMAMEIVISVVLLFVGIGVLLIIHVCVVGRAFREDSRTDSVSGEGDRAPAMAPEAVKNLPWFDHSESTVGTLTVECSVCLENFRVGDRCRILPVCGHCFHIECIDSWLMKTGACPVCRTSVAQFRQEEGRDMV
ncbi:RING-H2 finger protein ATL56-like [Andrographis paniculata]|uniref:RING-H2 finger protein ATL56-like n=1 Tax=Andrographis paniculata TaxID=175694 RepID=UPI0021E77E32|nr:RING-H2 finger protein ATL56-like [Andrographis paniculata]